MPIDETRIYIAIIIAVIILFALVVFFVTGIIRYQRVRIIKQREQVSADLLLLEQERLRLAEDLHDEFGMMISSIKMTLHCIETDDEKNIFHIGRAEALIDELMRKIRIVSSDLKPVHLQYEGLEKALRQLFETIGLKGQPEISFTYQVPTLSLEKKMHVYRLVQEITNNVIKHAAATKLRICISSNGKTFSIVAEDNGKGFDAQVLQIPGRGLGLQNIQRRVHLLKGKVFLKTAAGAGTSYLIELPLDDER